MLRPALLLLQLAIQPAGRADSLPPRDHLDSLRIRVDSATRAFEREWRGRWMETQWERNNFPDGFSIRDTARRVYFVHCHFEDYPSWVRERAITGATRAQAACPNWYPSGAKPPDDERRNIDWGLAAGMRWRIRQRRNDLRALLDSAAREMPRDVALTGQRVRFALDAKDTAGAALAASECAGPAAGCTLLHGFVLARLGLTAAADSAFLAATRQMGDGGRCAWSDVGMLLEPEQRRRYAAMSCTQRAELERRLWWLADPLWLEPGNERRVEHHARRVHLSLVEAGADDGRLRFAPKKGGEANAEALTRYGWPTNVYWGRIYNDTGHDSWLLRVGADTASPYVSLEYSRGRLHTVPRAEAIDAPLRATPDAWELTAPKGDDDWWPREHYARDASGIVQLPTGQGAMLRRREMTRFAWAGDLDASSLARAAGDTVRGTLFESRAPEEVHARAHARGRVSGTLVVDALMQAGAALVGVELPGDMAHPAARTRFAIDVPPPLAALGGSRALSQPLFFDPSADAARIVTADAAIARMYGTTTIERRRIGLYWESYGFAATDTVEIEIRVSREGRPGIFARIGGLLRLDDDGVSQVGMRWREGPESSRGLPLEGQGVPVAMRSIVLEISRLARGTYRFQVAMNRPGESAVTSERIVVLR